MSIVRLWYGYTTPANAGAYEAILRTEVIPGIEAMEIPGLQGSVEILRRDFDDEVEFVAVMRFESLEAVKAFVGEDYEVAHVPAEARAVLKRFDARSAHYVVVREGR